MINTVVMFIFEMVLHLQSMFAFIATFCLILPAQEALVILVLHALRATYVGRFANIVLTHPFEHFCLFDVYFRGTPIGYKVFSRRILQ